MHCDPNPYVIHMWKVRSDQSVDGPCSASRTAERMVCPAALGAQRLHRRVLAILYAVMPMPQHAFGFLYPGFAISGVQARIDPCKCLRADPRSAGYSLRSSSCCRSDALPGTDTPHPVCAAHPLRVAIVGAGGYIGSRLHAVLAQHCNWSVMGFDHNPQLRGGLPITNLAARNIPISMLHNYTAVIYFGGLTGRVACDAAGKQKSHTENVDDPVALASRMLRHQLFVFASTSAVAEGSGDHPIDEQDQVHTDLLDVYSASMLERERAMLALSLSANVPQLIGLRFGTVVGNSPGQRTDLGPMAMIRSAYTTGVLHVRHPETNRAYLWLEDLTRAFIDILTVSSLSSEPPRFAVYHLLSFNSKIGTLASAIAGRTSARIDTSDHAPAPDSIGFSLNGSLFSRTFKTSMKGTPALVIADLDMHVPDSITAKGAHIQLSHIVEDGTDEKPSRDVIRSHSEVRRTHLGGASHGPEGRLLISIPCPVCGSHDIQLVLDLHDQPLANDFFNTTDKALQAERYPLALMRCRSCNHMHLSHLVSRPRLFSHYLYVSGTSKTLLGHFEWLANRVSADVATLPVNMQRHAPSGKKALAVLELACNDGSQLDAFKKRGWKTYGVDPAANIAHTAIAKGHHIQVGFWGAENVWPPNELPVHLDAIVAQNVLAHVPSPVAFLRACAKAMGAHTLLYIQTSQCQMHEDGQFDTVYHEHLSFFTMHSFKVAAELSNLTIRSFETVPIHGISCFWTLSREKKAWNSSIQWQNKSSSVQQRLRKEVALGFTTDFFYERYNSRATATGMWLEAQLARLKRSGYWIGAYGAAAKGMVLLHFMLGRGGRAAAQLEFVLDDAPMKQGTFCPGTRIPIQRTSFVSELLKNSPQPLAIVVFAWNFLEEIRAKLTAIATAATPHAEPILIIQPFPSPRVSWLNGTTVSNMIYKPTPVSNLPHHPSVSGAPASANSTQRRVMLTSHFFNEELLLPYWIRHHAHMFDKVVLIDYSSTDRSVQIIKELAPPNWIVVNSSVPEFGAVELDKQVMSVQKSHPDYWHIALTTTEFLVHADLRGSLAVLDGERPMRIRAVMMAGNDSRPLGRYKDLATQRSLCTINANLKSKLNLNLNLNLNATGYERFIFGGPFMKFEWTYEPGRHDMTWVRKGKRPTRCGPCMFLQGGLILKYTWTPWPQVQSRLGQVGTRIPKTDQQSKGKGKRRFGAYHIHRLSPSFVNQSRQEMMTAEVFDLSDLYSLLRLSKALPSDTFAMLRSFHEAGLANMEPA